MLLDILGVLLLLRTKVTVIATNDSTLGAFASSIAISAARCETYQKGNILIEDKTSIAHKASTTCTIHMHVRALLGKRLVNME